MAQILFYPISSLPAGIFMKRAVASATFFPSAPVMAAALIAFCLSALTSFFLIPKGNLEAKNLLFAIVKQKASVGIKEKVFNDDFRGIVIYADRIPVSGDAMEGVMLYDDRTIDEPSTIVASPATPVAASRTLTVHAPGASLSAKGSAICARPRSASRLRV